MPSSRQNPYAKENGSTLRRFFCFAATLLCATLLLRGASPSEEISRLSRVMNWKAGDVFADVGAGDGGYAFEALTHLGPTGKVYATELDEKKLAALKKEVTDRGLKNVEILEAAEQETNLPPGCCDAILLRRVYHHLTAPDEIDASLLRALKPAGKLAIIDFPPRTWLTLTSPVKGVRKNRGGHGIPQKVLIAELTAAGFVVDQVINDWPEDDYCVIFRKANQAPK